MAAKDVLPPSLLDTDLYKVRRALSSNYPTLTR